MNLHLTIKPSLEMPPHKEKPRANKKDDDKDGLRGYGGTRLTVEHVSPDKNLDPQNCATRTFRISALTDNAANPVREITLQESTLTGAAERLQQSQTQNDQCDYGRMMHSLIIPDDFHGFIERSQALTLVIDRNSAALPWEMLGYSVASGTRHFGTDLKLTRQFRTLLSAAPSVAPPLNQELRVLVIADPAGGDLSLPGARQEGVEIVNTLNRLRKEFKEKQGIVSSDDPDDFSVLQHLRVISRIGSEECDWLEIMKMIFNIEFDIIHFSGHGIYDEREPANSGWVFGRDPKSGKLLTLSAREIFRVRRVPRLVFSMLVSRRKQAAANPSRHRKPTSS